MQGVILYEMLSGTSPFTEKKKGVNLTEQIRTADYVFPPILFDRISNEARDLIQKLLVVDPEERLSSEQILRHPWLQVTRVTVFSILRVLHLFPFPGFIFWVKIRKLFGLAII